MAVACPARTPSNKDWIWKILKILIYFQMYPIQKEHPNIYPRFALNVWQNYAAR
jgi:hypothetical protein